MRSTRVDLYAVLGVARSATVADLRRAYRQLALAHHPDRAGPSSAATFAGVADAYRVLSNPVARAAYDASLADQDAWSAAGAGPVHAGGMDWNVATSGADTVLGTSRWRPAARPLHIPDLLPRLSGPIADLTASRTASVAPDGFIELHLNAREAASGGTAAIQMPLRVVCSSCGGVARPRGVWCRSCQHDGQVTEQVTVCIRVPAYVHSGTILSMSPRGVIDTPIQVRIFVHGLRPTAAEE